MGVSTMGILRDNVTINEVCNFLKEKNVEYEIYKIDKSASGSKYAYIDILQNNKRRVLTVWEEWHDRKEVFKRPTTEVHLGYNEENCELIKMLVKEFGGWFFPKDTEYSFKKDTDNDYGEYYEGHYEKTSQDKLHDKLLTKMQQETDLSLTQIFESINFIINEKDALIDMLSDVK